MSYQQPPTMPEGSYSAGRSPSANYGQPTAHLRQHRDPHSENVMTNMANTLTNTHLGIPGSAHVTSNGAGQFPTGQFFFTQDGQYVYAPPPAVYQQQQAVPSQALDGNYGQYHAPMQAVPQVPFPGYIPGYPVMSYTTGRATYYPDRHEALNVKQDVPGLENRRGSYSTNESAPGTPFYGSYNSRDQGGHVTVIDRSPIYSTPSPQQLSHPHAGSAPLSKPVPFKSSTVNTAELDALLQQAPSIPPAVPAVYTLRENMRTLEQSLSNPIPGNRNVYIRGLHPNTDDETLAAYTSRFGKVETSKAIIDTSTGACKGFGFAKYFESRDSDNCIRGFYKLGYEVGFARESFNSRLKAEGDEMSTNLYVSNLPKSMTESELGAVFMDYKVSSSRILRDNHGQSRGVGFARFEGRDVCEEVIKKFHGQPIGDEGLLLQVRYADTPAQKSLKRLTTERRQFRTEEYNIGAYGKPSESFDGSNMSTPLLPTVRMAQITRQIPLPRGYNGPWKREVSSSSNVSSTSGGGVHFADVNHGAARLPQNERSGNKELEARVTTPTISEDGSNDEITIHCASPAVASSSLQASPKPEKI